MRRGYVLAALLFGAAPALAQTTIHVTTTLDELNSDGDCSLREAVQAANTDAVVDACPAGSGADVVELAAEEYLLTIPMEFVEGGTSAGENGNLRDDIDIASEILIRGAGAAITTITGNGSDAMFHVLPDASAEFSDVTIRRGGAVHFVAGPDVDDVGGGLFNEGTARVERTVFTDFIYHAGTAVAVFNAGTLWMEQSAIHHTVSYHGSFGNSGTAHLVNSTISDAHPDVNASGSGGGIANFGGTLTLFGVTVHDVHTLSSRHQPSISNSGTGTVKVRNSIILGRSIYNGGDCSSEGIISEGYNLTETHRLGECDFNQPTDIKIAGSSELLAIPGPLTDNGGPTPTHALLPGNPAINAGTCVDADGNLIGVDQRGFGRPEDGACDIGAFEFGASPVAEDLEAPECQLVSITPGPPTTLTVHVQDHGSGLASIEVLQSRNATVTWSVFETGSTEAVTVTGEKVNQGKRAVVAIRATDVAGNATTCDPVIDQTSAEVPDRFALDANYPNPFNPATTIRFAVAEPVHARLAVYDVLGREVALLVDEDLTGGTYEVVFDAAGLPSGTYVYRLDAGSYVEVRSMVLAK